ncbi:MAG: UDP-N-acetylmuramoyl-L-alanyl-D-glutamate--2,6-diaminopimelate ligase [Bacteroidia bacterium]
MTLRELLYNVGPYTVQGSLETEVSGVAFDSRKVGLGSLFVAVRGTQVDGHAYMAAAVDRGAAAIVCETLPEAPAQGVAYVLVAQARAALAHIAANWYGRPADRLLVVGITGTNGKTTCATLLYRLCTQMGIRAGLVSTIEYRIGTEVMPSSHTTPDPLQLHALFAQMLEAGCVYCFMEVSSHALVQDRVLGVPFHVAAFTNITRDHLDYHGTFAEYIRAKRLLFDHLPATATAIVNADDRNGRVMVQNTAASVQTFALKHMADYRAQVLTNSVEGLHLRIDGQEVWFRLRGSFNAYNLLTVYAVARALELDVMEVLHVLSGLEGADGRFEVLRDAGGRTAVVDYAHTPDALLNVLTTIEDVTRDQGRIIAVVGCGGNRDRGKRPEMGRIAAEHADQVIFTSDNPRDEDPETIIGEMYAGVPETYRSRVLRITDRREAIYTACALARARDVILVAGKGHETYQEIRGVRYPFDDRDVLRERFGSDATG